MNKRIIYLNIIILEKKEKKNRSTCDYLRIKTGKNKCLKYFFFRFNTNLNETNQLMYPKKSTYFFYIPKKASSRTEKENKKKKRWKILKISFYIVKINTKNFLEIYIYEEYPTIVKTIEMVYYLYYWKENEINDKKNIDQEKKNNWEEIFDWVCLLCLCSR